MIRDSALIFLVLLAVVAGAAYWSNRFKNSALMRYLPTPIWCYIPPTVLTTLGILPMQSAVYDWIGRFVLPASLILILMTTRLTALVKLGRMAVIAMLGASFTVILGGIAAFFLFRNWIGPESWKAVGTLAASWIGGTANMVAVKNAVGLSDQSFTPLFISDITVVYLWMTFLMILSGSQKKIDRLLHAKRTTLERLISETSGSEPRTGKIPTRSFVSLVAAGFGAGALAIWLGERIPLTSPAMTSWTWVIILVTTFGIALSFSNFAKKENKNSMTLGYFLLYLTLAATGAKANLLALFAAPLFLLMCLSWAFIHGGLLIALGRLFRIPSALLAAASQANLGSVASAPIVASTYEPKLVPAALIFAIFGNAIANYLGLLTAHLLRLIS